MKLNISILFLKLCRSISGRKEEIIIPVITIRGIIILTPIPIHTGGTTPGGGHGAPGGDRTIHTGGRLYHLFLTSFLFKFCDDMHIKASEILLRVLCSCLYLLLRSVTISRDF